MIDWKWVRKEQNVWSAYWFTRGQTASVSPGLLPCWGEALVTFSHTVVKGELRSVYTIYKGAEPDTKVKVCMSLSISSHMHVSFHLHCSAAWASVKDRSHPTQGNHPTMLLRSTGQCASIGYACATPHCLEYPAWGDHPAQASQACH